MSKRTNNLFVWKTRTEDGRKRQVEAKLFGSKWTLRSRLVDEEDWTTHGPPLLDDLEQLHEMLENKYRRKHLAWDILLSVKNLIEARK